MMLNPKQLQALMKQMGIKATPLPAKKVVIETEGKNIIITAPQVIVIEAKGEKTFQITGEIKEEEKEFSEEDVKLVMEQAGCSEEEAKEALQKANGDIAKAIIMLSEGREH